MYLCLPAMRMGTHARWFRLMILLALSVMERTQVKPPAPVLFVLDEFPVLGHMQVVEKAAGLMAGFGVKLWIIVQNLGQLKQHYDKAWETFFANSGVVTAFGVVDHETAKRAFGQARAAADDGAGRDRRGRQRPSIRRRGVQGGSFRYAAARGRRARRDIQPRAKAIADPRGGPAAGHRGAYGTISGNRCSTACTTKNRGGKSGA